ncbi:hypothetical protein FOA52_014744 [Chlamydomonas sp. UWO 241]|nr:hypothetical protein FOA52_014744 [Chlamydomonas sp. UWO 241]
MALALCMCLSSPCSASASQHAHDRHWLPHHCRKPLSRLSTNERARLRDVMQTKQRCMREARLVALRLRTKLGKGAPGSDLAQDAAQASPLSLEQLQAAVQEGRLGATSRRMQRGRPAGRPRATHDAVAAAEAAEKAAVAGLTERQVLPPQLPQGLLSACLMGHLNPQLYPDTPQVSFMLQYYRRPWMIPTLVEALRSCTDVATELVVNVDSDDPQSRVWAELASNTSGWVVPIFSANVHEIRAYNRMAGVARGTIVVALQDDSTPPPGCGWLLNLTRLFDTHPSLGAVGMKIYRFNQHGENKNTGEGRTMFFKDPLTGIPFNFVQLVDFGPLAFRRSAYRGVGGLDEGMSEAGMCGIYSDFEICVRLWAAGWQVGYMPLEVTHDVDKPGGTHVDSATEWRCWRLQLGLAVETHTDRWQGMRPQTTMYEQAQEVRRLDLTVLARNNDGPGEWVCPFIAQLGGCDLGSNGTAGAASEF